LEQALQLVRDEQPESLDRALALLQNTVYSFSMKVCGHAQDAEDNAQDVLLKSLPHLASMRRELRPKYEGALAALRSRRAMNVPAGS